MKIFHLFYFQGFSEDQELSARSSFPSGHASQAAFAAIFLTIFVQVSLTAGWLSGLICHVSNSSRDSWVDPGSNPAWGYRQINVH